MKMQVVDIKREKIRASYKEYNQKNKEKLAAYQKEYLQKNREKILERKREYERKRYVKSGIYN